MSRTLIRIDDNPRLFNLRVAGVAFRDGHVLVHRAIHELFWTFPGGRGEIGESSVDTLRREMREELDVEADVERLLWSVENFFRFEKRDYHELGFYYLMRLPDHFAFDPGRIIHRIVDGPHEIEFKWVPATAEALQALPLQPDFIPSRIEALPEEGEHLIWHEVVPE